MTSKRAADDEERTMSRETIFSLYLPAVVLALGTGIALPAIPTYAKSFDISFGTASLVVVVQALGQLVATFPTGYMVDKWGRKPVLILGPALTALAAFLTVIAGSFPELLFYRFLTGAGTIMWNQARLAMISDAGGDRQRGKLITWMMSVQSFGMLFAPALGGFLAAIDIRLPFIVHGILLLLILVPMARMSKETRPDRQPGAVREPTSGEWSYIFTEIRKPTMLAFMAAQFCANLTRGSTSGLLTLYAAFAYNVGPATLGLMGTANSLITLPIGFATGVIMDRFGRKMTVVPGFAAMFLFSVFLAATAVFDSSFGVFLGAFFGLHGAQGITGGNMQVLGSDLAPPRARGRFFAIWRLFGEGGSTASPLIFTWLTVVASYAAAFMFVGFSALAVAMIIARFIPETVGRMTKRPTTGPPLEVEAATVVPAVVVADSVSDGR